MSERYGFNRALCRAAAAQVAAIRVHDRGVLAESRHFERDDPDGAGRYTAAAAAAAGRIDLRDALQAWLQSPRSSCFHVNSGFAWVREKG
jgi:hypothetical protein